MSFALMLRRKNAHIAAGYASQPCSSLERKILRALRVFRRGGWQSALAFGAEQTLRAPTATALRVLEIKTAILAGQFVGIGEMK